MIVLNSTTNSYEFLKEGEFWINFTIGFLSLLFSIFAWVAAKRSKRAALEAKKVVRSQSIIIDLIEIISKTKRVKPESGYNYIKELFEDINPQIKRRITSYFERHEYRSTIAEIEKYLNNIQSSLNLFSTYIKDGKEIESRMVFERVISDFNKLSEYLSVFIGLLEQKTNN